MAAVFVAFMTLYAIYRGFAFVKGVMARWSSS
jgi:hypothetical protein